MSIRPFFNNNTKEDDTRKKEFENSIGNLLVAEYQVFRLRERIKNHLGSIDIEESSFMFKVGDEWYKIDVSAQRQKEPVEPKPKEEPNKQLVKPKKQQRTHGINLNDQPAAPTYEAWFAEDYTSMP